MPNWLEGDLKIRGRRKNVQKFMSNVLPDINVEYLEDYELMKLTGTGLGSYAWFKGMLRRAFIKMNEQYSDESGWVENYKDDSGILILNHVNIAWGFRDFEIDNMVKVSKEFDVDIRFQGSEMGMQFESVLEVSGGKVVVDEVKKYDNYVWEATNPQLGG